MKKVILNNKPQPVRNQRGQAITEFNITAAFLLVPLFLLIPLLGKYIDIKHSSVQAARYMVWERTVWFEEAPKFTTSAAVKSVSILENETISRNFGDSDREISRNDKSDMTKNDINLLWKDSGGVDLVNVNNISAKIPKGDEEVPSVTYKIFNELTNVIDTVANFLGDLLVDGLDWFNDVVDSIFGGRPIPVPDTPIFDITSKFHFEGYYQSEVRVPVNNILYVEGYDSLNLEMVSHAAVLTDAWTAAGNEGEEKEDTPFADWTESFVPFAVVREPFSYAQDIFSYRVPVIGISLAPELAKDKLIFGYVDTDPVTDSSVEADCPDGLCSYEN